MGGMTGDQLQSNTNKPRLANSCLGIKLQGIERSPLSYFKLSLITTQGLTSLPLSVQRHFRRGIRTYMTGHVGATEAQELAAHAPTATAGELCALDRYQWCLHQPAIDPGQTTQFTSPPPQLLRPDDH